MPLFCMTKITSCLTKTFPGHASACLMQTSLCNSRFQTPPPWQDGIQQCPSTKSLPNFRICMASLTWWHCFIMIHSSAAKWPPPALPRCSSTKLSSARRSNKSESSHIPMSKSLRTPSAFLFKQTYSHSRNVTHGRQRSSRRIRLSGLSSTRRKVDVSQQWPSAAHRDRMGMPPRKGTMWWKATMMIPTMIPLPQSCRRPWLQQIQAHPGSLACPTFWLFMLILQQQSISYQWIKQSSCLRWQW